MTKETQKSKPVETADPDKVVLDRKTIKALGVSTRLEILKTLHEKEHTLTDLATRLQLAVPTIKDHLAELEAAGLIKKEETERKWKYYKITFKGRRIVSPYETKVVFSLFASLGLAIVSIYALAKQKAGFGSMNVATTMKNALSTNAAENTRMMQEPLSYAQTIDNTTAAAFQAPQEQVFQTAQQTMQHQSWASQEQTLWIFMLIIALLGIAISLLLLLKKKSRR
ncbi:MAG: winged helix-turn-helix domain-containing protein [Candidatus Woesearchaeota archaeon]